MQTRHMPSAAICCAVFFATGSVFAEDALTINLPLERQVTQRTARNQADITIAGVVEGLADVIEAKADLGKVATRGKAADWTTIAQGPAIAEGKFSGKLSLEAGGWYVISIRALRGKQVIATGTITKVGVGEVFITAGQSNSANYGTERQAAKDDRVVYFNDLDKNHRETGATFIPAEDPIPGGAGKGGSPWALLGDHIVKSQQVPVCFESCMLVYASSKSWHPGGGLHKDLIKGVTHYGKHGVRAVLWHQGESDSIGNVPAQTYCDNLTRIIEALDKEAGYEIPWFVAQASFHPHPKATAAAQEQVAKGQHLLWERGIAHKGPNTDDLGPEYRHKWDKVHFNQRGLTTHAQRWFEALAAEYKWKTEPSN
jgi:hypothetical protein